MMTTTEIGNEPAAAPTQRPLKKLHRPRPKVQEPKPQLEPVVKETPAATVLQDLIAGGVAGSASVVVGHPFDTYKVRLQTSSASSGKAAASSKSFGGFGSLFRGMGAPLATATVVNAMIFSSFGESSRWWDEHMEDTDENGVVVGSSDSAQADDHTTTSLTKTLACGSFAGLAQCLVLCPTEHVKCRLQVQHGLGSADHLYRGPLDAVDKIVQGHGMRGLFRGWWATVLREVPAFGLYFASYDDIKNRITRALEASGENGKKEPLVPTHLHAWAASAIAGGMAGSVTWAVVYPVDVIKSRIQTSPLDSQAGMWKVGRELVRENGWRYMFRGLGVTLGRAFPVNGIIFPVYEFTLKQLTKSGIGGK